MRASSKGTVTSQKGKISSVLTCNPTSQGAEDPSRRLEAKWCCAEVASSPSRRSARSLPPSSSCPSSRNSVLPPPPRLARALGRRSLAPRLQPMAPIIVNLCCNSAHVIASLTPRFGHPLPALSCLEQRLGRNIRSDVLELSHILTPCAFLFCLQFRLVPLLAFSLCDKRACVSCRMFASIPAKCFASQFSGRRIGSRVLWKATHLSGLHILFAA